MRRLEKAGINYGAIQEYKDFIEKHYPGRKSISEKKQTKGISLRGEIYKLQSILDMPTSTVTGIRKIENKRLETFKKKYGIEFENSEELRKFVQSDYFKQLSKIYSSKQAVRIVSESKYSIDEINNRLQDFRLKTGKDVISSSALLRQLGFRNKSSVLKAISENIRRN